MKLSVKSAAMLLAVSSISTVSFAGEGSGCGLGQTVFEGQSGLVPNILAATTNGTSGNQTFGLTFGTSGCDAEAVVKNDTQREIFVAANFDNLAQEMAQGYGDHLASLATIMKLEKKDKAAFYTLTQNKFSQIFGAETVGSSHVIASLDAAMSQDEKLAKYVQL
ncbi:MAG TPA: DUF3015 domain-containing protein [Gammaproteobacteria bacterium]|nr:DUF3015 domain-containing protein [Gammaproteobacteria bacterium]